MVLLEIEPIPVSVAGVESSTPPVGMEVDQGLRMLAWDAVVGQPVCMQAVTCAYCGHIWFHGFSG